MNLPASFYRAEAAYLEPPDIDDLPGDFGPAFPEPGCWGFNSYEHYKGECRHFQEDGHELPSGYVDARTCWNKDCQYFVQWFCDYEPGDPCEGCGQPLGDEK